MDWFARRLLRWFDRHGRKELPWQRDPSPYRVWISEIMLQQTRVATVIPYFERFMARFPDASVLARAELDEVLHLWSGLGYYTRARNLHRAAWQLVEAHDGELPASREALLALPGIGESTAGAILAIAHGQRATILDGNVKRVLARFHGERGHAGQSAWITGLWRHAEAHTPERRLPDYTQAIMDLGALICTRRRPHCHACPLRSRCSAHRQGVAETLPEPRPRRSLPVRRVRMFLLEAPDGRFLLEQRPPTGLWGGLWGPPERAAEAEPGEVLAELLPGARAANGGDCGPVLRHSFTHFHMDIEPIHLRLAGPHAAVAAGDRLRWYHPGSSDRIGLSAAASALLSDKATGDPR